MPTVSIDTSVMFFLIVTALTCAAALPPCTVMTVPSEAWHLASLAQEPIYLVSGFYFPLRSLNFWIVLSASIIPLALGMDAMRQLVFPDGESFGFLSVNIEIFILALLSVVFLVAAFILLARMERLAIQEGRITESRR